MLCPNIPSAQKVCAPCAVAPSRIDEAVALESYQLLTPPHPPGDDALWFMGWLAEALHAHLAAPCPHT
ncbi:hypothetical protein EGT09_05740 [Pseudomonas putida]|uniref:hypothetical protein n=1 Tax=Pseudomonas putida TaxID=303 RepID=UPI000F7AEEFF|nr:hypothetical protein [Pseudomonas putida]RSC25936.1 hypothetical protein EGT09_05740 [Pseudomonas putida]